MLKKERKPFNYTILIICSILISFGILILSSVSGVLSYEKFGTTYYYLFHQIKFGILPGIILGFIFFKINLNYLKKVSPYLLFFSLISLAIVFIPHFGLTLGGATRWLKIGSFSFQPSEFLKIFFFLYLAYWLENRKENQNNFTKIKRSKKYQKSYFNKEIIYIFLVCGIITLLLIKQPNLSTLGIILGVGLIMYFLANTPFWHSGTIFLILISSFYFFIKTTPYRLNRLLIFLNREVDPQGIGYQINQSMIAIGSGGILGLGLGMSKQKFGFLPESISDTIFSILAEETGFIGGSILIILFIIFLWQGFKISKKSKDLFSKITALGITSWIFLQAIINIAAMIKIFPLTGIPLPFISYGGSHIIAELIGLGILLNISKKNYNL